MANHRRGKTYVGVTSNLPQRVYQHRNGLADGCTKEHDCKMLVWFERFENVQDARAHELRMKKWHRAWKLRVIEERNAEWRDLLDEILH